ncbi:Uncharacterised protein [Mycobacteroides abscessus subsp. abscessus]|nr:Uncharacterised protein [Mycobacteroides abscessus subsp. abscessus]
MVHRPNETYEQPQSDTCQYRIPYAGMNISVPAGERTVTAQRIKFHRVFWNLALQEAVGFPRRNLLRYKVGILKSLIIHHNDLCTMRLHSSTFAHQRTLDDSLLAGICWISFAFQSPDQQWFGVRTSYHFKRLYARLIGPQMIGMAVTTTVIVSHHYVRAACTNHRSNS